METQQLTTLTQDANLIIDCDEILVNISPKWTKRLYDNKEVFKDYLDFSILDKCIENQELFLKVVFSRPEFYLTKWLAKEDTEIPPTILKKFMELYDTEDFYYDLPLTRMAIGLSKLSYHPSVKKVYVVTRCSSEKNYEGKLRLIQSLFPSKKLEIIKVDAAHKKSDYIKNIDIENGFIFDDELNNVRDYLNAGVSKCNIYIPMMGYNKPDELLIGKAQSNEVCICYY